MVILIGSLLYRAVSSNRYFHDVQGPGYYDYSWKLPNKAKRAYEEAHNVDVHALREILAFFYSNEFMFMFLVVMGLIFYKVSKR